MDRPVPEASRAATGRRRGVAPRRLVAALLALVVAGEAAAADRLAPYVGRRYVNSPLGFMLELPRNMTACRLPRERAREGIVFVVARGASCDAIGQASAFITVTGEPNAEALGDVESLAASICAHPRWGEARVGPARRTVAGLTTLSCMMQEENGNVVIEAMAQRPRAGRPPGTWTNLRISLVAPGDRWPEFTRLFEDIIERVSLLPDQSSPRARGAR